MLFLVLALSLVNCNRLDRTRPSSSLEKCLAEFKRIPEVDAVLQSRDSGQDSVTDPEPFKGIEIALTLNGAILATANPDADADDVCYKQNNLENLQKLIDTLKQYNLPPTVDFVNARYVDTEVAGTWLAAGNQLGNLTYDNRRAVQLDAHDFISDASKADERLAVIWSQHPQPTRYFRYPALKTVKDENSRTAVEQYLAQAGYTTVPYTIESMDDRLADIYCRAQDAGDKSCSTMVKLNYYAVLMDTTLRAKSAARQLAGRDPSHILVLFMNQLTFDTLAQTIAWYQRLGARFISLDKALADPFYKMTSNDGDPMGITVVNTVRDEQLSLGK
jgi:peptidoglycan/xylan/chitin deacetylase (PgdA/CDA1 family)